MAEKRSRDLDSDDMSTVQKRARKGQSRRLALPYARIPRTLSIRGTQPGITTIHRSFALAQVFCAPTAQAIGSYIFLASYVYDINSLQQVYDQYRVDYLKFTFMNGYDSYPASASLAIQRPIWYTALDFDDASVISNAALMDYDNIMHHTGTSFSRSFVPTSKVGAAGATSIVRRQWYDTADQAVTHYGLRIGSTVAPSGNGFLVNCQCTVTLSLRNSR